MTNVELAQNSISAVMETREILVNTYNMISALNNDCRNSEVPKANTQFSMLINNIDELEKLLKVLETMSKELIDRLTPEEEKARKNSAMDEFINECFGTIIAKSY